MKKSKYLVLTALAAFALGGCTPAPTPEPDPEVIPVTSVVLDKTSATLSVGDTLQLVASVNPTDATVKDLVWTTSDATVASVSGTGYVTAKDSGEAVITATAKGTDIKATCTVTVEAAVLTDWTDAQKAEMTEAFGIVIPFIEGMTTDWAFQDTYIDFGYLSIESPEAESAEAFAEIGSAYYAALAQVFEYDETEDYFHQSFVVSYEGYETTFTRAVYVNAGIYAVDEAQSAFTFLVTVQGGILPNEVTAWPADAIADFFGDAETGLIVLAAEKYEYLFQEDYYGDMTMILEATPAEGESLDVDGYLEALAANFDITDYVPEDEEEETYPVDKVIENDVVYGYLYGSAAEGLTFQLYALEEPVPPTPVGEGIVINRAVVCQASGLDASGTYSYAQSAYTATVDGVQFEFSTGVGMATSKNNAGFHGLECMQWRKIPAKEGDKEVGHMGNVTALATDKIVIEFYVTFASEDFKYLPVVKASETKEGTFEAVLPDGVTSSSTVNGEATELKDGGKVIYKYELTYTLDGADFFTIETGAGALFIKTITIVPTEAQ